MGGIAQYKYLSKLDACRNDANTLKKFLDATNVFDDICFLGPDTTGGQAKKIISEFVQKHKEDKIDELFFYFSGHGDRTEEDFFYAMSDYKADKKETGGLRNSELDSLIRNFSPELTIKIVDACYAGSSYIKTDDDIRPVIQKSAKESELKKLYFFYSSAADQTSWAGTQFSHFTLALFQALASQSGPVRYRDLMAAVADEMNSSGAPKPTFVVQADSLETFVQIDTQLSALLKAEIGIPISSDSESGEKNQADGQLGSDTTSPVDAVSARPIPLAELASIKAQDIYCTEEEATANIEFLNSELDGGKWPQEIRDAYEIEIHMLSEDSVPNKLTIAKWIGSLKDDLVFAVQNYAKQTYTVEEYKEVPKKPSSTANAFSAFATLQKIWGEDKEYKLEPVKKEREVVSGFSYTVDPIFSPRRIMFVPRSPSLEHYAACVVCLFSRRTLTCLYSVEHLPYTGWNKAQPAKASKWMQMSVPLKDKERILNSAKRIISEVSEFIEGDARQRLS